MNNISIYNNKKNSKINIEIPLFITNKSMFSLYSPDKDAQNFTNQLHLEEKSCVLGGGRALFFRGKVISYNI